MHGQKQVLDDVLNGVLSAIGLGDSLPRTWSILIVMLVVVLLIQVGISAFLKTEIGLAIRATGDNESMVKSFSAHTDHMKILGLAISNALVAFAGALVAQYHGFTDIGNGNRDACHWLSLRYYRGSNLWFKINY